MSEFTPSEGIDWEEVLRSNAANAANVLKVNLSHLLSGFSSENDEKAAEDLAERLGKKE